MSRRTDCFSERIAPHASDIRNQLQKFTRGFSTEYWEKSYLLTLTSLLVKQVISIVQVNLGKHRLNTIRLFSWNKMDFISQTNRAGRKLFNHWLFQRPWRLQGHLWHSAETNDKLKRDDMSKIDNLDSKTRRKDKLSKSQRWERADKDGPPGCGWSYGAGVGGAKKPTKKFAPSERV